MPRSDAVEMYMSFLYDYIRGIDVRQLEAGEVSQCLLYLDHLEKTGARNRNETAPVREKLQERLSGLREAKKPR